ncbi:hypothetical protein GMOD_00005055 [Pyrenophora seminiperda CCB06]
MRSTS